MALQDTLKAVTASAPRCRIERLLATVDMEDALTLRGALINSGIRPVDLTTALRREYGKDAVTDKSVGEWRRKNLDATEVNGL